MSGDRWPLCEGPPEQGRGYLKVWPHDLTVGRRFDTEFESSCEVSGPVDEYGSFLACDSDGVECEFNILMVVRIHD